MEEPRRYSSWSQSHEGIAQGYCRVFALHAECLAFKSLYHHHFLPRPRCLMIPLIPFGWKERGFRFPPERRFFFFFVVSDFRLLKEGVRT